MTLSLFRNWMECRIFTNENHFHMNMNFVLRSGSTGQEPIAVIQISLSASIQLDSQSLPT